jgi:hypothetical protein
MPPMTQPPREIDFSKLWKGGFYTGDPMDPVAQTSLRDFGYISSLYAIYRYCIRPYIQSDTVAVEIGPGRGAWTRAMLPGKEIWCLDALSAEHNHFWQYVGEQHRDKIHYHQVSDFECSVLPDNHFDYLFSYDTFCHISPHGRKAYLRNLFPKMKPGAHAFVMIGDFDKYNAAVQRSDQLRVRKLEGNPISASLGLAARYLYRLARQGTFNVFESWPDSGRSEDAPAPGGWFHMSTRATVEYLREVGWEVLEEDIELSMRDPIIHFRKPL